MFADKEPIVIPEDHLEDLQSPLKRKIKLTVQNTSKDDDKIQNSLNMIAHNIQSALQNNSTETAVKLD